MGTILLRIGDLFPTVLRMSISAGILTLAVVLLRFVLRKAPKWASCLLWLLVALRLLCPVMPQARLSLMPRSEAYFAVEQRMDAAADRSGLPPLEFEITQAPAEGTEPALRGFSVVRPGIYLTALWPLGILAMLLYALGSWLRLRQRTAASVPCDDGVLLCDEIGSPFILGVFRPKICIPSRLTSSQRALALAHEQAHLRRRDNWWKPLGFLLLTVHWFNPLLWLAYVLLCRDIELACDEWAVRDMEASDRADYAQALLDCSFPRKTAGVCPLAFGEVGVRQRVKSVLNYRRPAFWIAAAAVLLCLLAALFFLTDPAVLLPEDGPVVLAEYASVGDNVRLSPEAWTALTERIEESRGSRFPARTDPLGLLSASVTLRYADGSYVLVHYQYVSGFDFLRGREDDYRTVVTWFDAEGKARKAWRLENAFDGAFLDWRSRWIPKEENDLDWLWRNYTVHSVLYESGVPWPEVSRCYVTVNYELMVAGADGEWRSTGTLERFSPDKENFDAYYRGYDSAEFLRRKNRLAWRAVSPEGDFFCDLLYQTGGDMYLALGTCDAGETGGRDPDDRRVCRILRLTGTQARLPEGKALELDALEEKYPEYFGLSTFKGLELYVWQMGPESWSCGLMEGTNRNKTNEEIWNLRGSTAEEMKQILSTYDIPEEDISIIPFLHPASSYWFDIDEGYRERLRTLFFGGPEESAGEAVPGESPLLTVSCGGVSVEPYTAGRWAETWTGDGWLAADGEPVEASIREHGDEIPVLILDGELTLTLGKGASRSNPMLRVFDIDLNLLVRRDDKSFEALYELPPGDYWCSMVVTQRGDYVPSENRYESFGYDCVFRLWIRE